MSIKNKLLAMTGDLTATPVNLPPAAAPAAGFVAPPAALAEPARFAPAMPGGSPAPRTGPGQMAQFRNQMLAAEGELGKLRERLREHEGALPTRKLDPATIHPGHWANRHDAAFRSAAFESLKQDIAQAGGNVQPILVRPHPIEPGQYEVVFGHRRHRACLELGIAVTAVIDSGPMSDADVFAAMDRENRERADLSPFEQGQMYRRALDESLYPSNRRLAEALGVSHTWVSNVLAVADLPQPIVECFASPLEIQHRHARQINQALERDRKGVLKRAEKLRQASRTLSASAVVGALLAPPTAAAVIGTSIGGPLELDGRSVGRWSQAVTGALSIELKPGVVGTVDGGLIAQALVRALQQVGEDTSAA
ncbi:ParB/RepB/Spo0J family partition protein [Pseudaquabacterium rugosum]|uniref:ParB/RepB/Spo0J family partition protein n=1 Tax=Pseudaquabacterium rugosum TaxID=2984194 RepID=A0ABU9B7S1_9BURK